MVEMASTMMLAGVIVLIMILALIYFLFSNPQSAGLQNGMTNVAVQMTDPPKVPQGTQHLVVSYSSVEVHSSGAGNQSGWVQATGSGTVDLMALTNASETIANADVAANSTINLIRFNITSAQITINGTTYNVSSPNNKINVAVTGSQKLGANSAVLIDFQPTVNAHATGNSNATAYVLAPAASAIVVSSNATVTINTNIGSMASLGAGIKAKLGLGIGIGSSGNNNTTAGRTGTAVIVHGGQRVSNFLVQSVNYSSGTVSGLLYVQYPVATNVGENVTLHISGYVGYACDNTEFRLTGVYSNGTAAFTPILNTSTPGGCPI
ncbi:MAG: DUF4382 domain-containing protein [Candidatus Micrarchaeota archaeon]|nr:DUF4382 domain-containing protein [Candidatus Micrarchaeota archaeon]